RSAMPQVEEIDLSVDGVGRRGDPCQRARRNELGSGERNEHVAQPLWEVHGEDLSFHLVGIDLVKTENAIAIAYELGEEAGAEHVDGENGLTRRLGHVEPGGSDLVVAPFAQ